MAIISGHGGDISADGVSLQAEEWNGTYEATVIETTNHSSGGFYSAIHGPKKLTGSASGKWDPALNSGDPNAILTPQTGVAFVLNKGASAAGGSYAFTGNINSVGITSAAASGELTFQMDFESSGTVTENDPS